MKQTIRLYDFFSAELEKIGYSEFVSRDKKRLIYTTDDNIVRKILTFDDDIQEIVNKYIFYGETLDNVEHDLQFKKMIIAKFWDKQIKFQTIELTASRMLAIFLKHKTFLNYYYTEIDKFMTSESISESTGTGKNANSHREGIATLPQNQVNLDLNDDTLTFADENRITKTLSEDNNNSNSTTKTFSMQNLKDLNFLLDSIIRDFEKACFIRIF